MSTPPPVPAVPDADRYLSVNIGAAILPSVMVPFPIYGDDTDLDVRFAGAPLDRSTWFLVSASAPGALLDSLPRPITDGQVMFVPPLSGGLLEIVGATRPRQTTMPSAPGIARREFNQTIGNITSTLREFWRGLKSQSAGAFKFDAAGPLAYRVNYNSAPPGFLYLQTDDVLFRPIYYAKLSTTFGDWSGPLIVTGPRGAAGTNGTNGTNGVNGAYTATDPIATSVAAGDYVPIQQGGVSKRATRDVLLAAIPANLRATKLWNGEGQSSGAVSAPIVIMADGTPRCWGLGTDGGNGDPSAGARWLPKTMHFNVTPAAPAPTLPIVQCARAGTSVYILDSAGLVYAMGGNAVGQLGVNDTSPRTRFTLIATLRTAGIQVAEIITQPGVASATAGSTVYFRTTTGQLYACGANASGQIGDGTTSNRTVPTRCGTLTNITKVAVAVDISLQNFVMALDSSGNLYAWGFNSSGQIGDGSTTPRTAPFLTATAVVDMAVNLASSTAGHAILVKANGNVQTIGSNTYGQIGDGTTTARNAWTLVVGITTASKCYAGGGLHGMSAILLTNGTLQLWGANTHGNLGTGGTADQLTPYTPAGAFQNKVTSFHNAGWLNATISGVFCSDGTVWVAGYNNSGAAGQANGFADVTTFQQVRFPFGITSPVTAIKFLGLSAAGSSSLSLFALLADGTLWATGANALGQLGTQSGSLHDVDALEKVIFT